MPREQDNMIEARWASLRRFENARADEAKYAEATPEDLEFVRRWIRHDDYLPEPDTEGEVPEWSREVLVFQDFRNTGGKAWQKIDRYDHAANEWRQSGCVTHWRDLPPDPEDER